MSQFIGSGTTNDKSKWHTVVAAIESNVLAQVRHCTSAFRRARKLRRELE